jgi:hypothetical protein
MGGGGWYSDSQSKAYSVTTDYRIARDTLTGVRDPYSAASPSYLQFNATPLLLFNWPSVTQISVRVITES